MRHPRVPAPAELQVTKPISTYKGNFSELALHGSVFVVSESRNRAVGEK